MLDMLFILVGAAVVVINLLVCSYLVKNFVWTILVQFVFLDIWSINSLEVIFSHRSEKYFMSLSDIKNSH